MNLNALFGFIPSCIGLFMIALGAFFYFRTKKFSEKAQEAKGTVTELAYDSDSEGSGYYTIFQFTTISGQVIEKSGNIRSSPPAHTVGEVIDVLYDPANPNDARIKKTSSLYFVPMLLGGMGIVFFCLGIFIFMLGLFGLF